MQETHIVSLFRHLEDSGVKFKDEHGQLLEHWICPSDWGSIKKKNFVERIFKMLGADKIDFKYFYPRKLKSCQHKYCINPDCYYFSKKYVAKATGKGYDMKTQDLEELAEDIDLEEYYKVGAKKYLEEFNASMPEFLRITEKQLELVIDWKGKTND